MTCSEWSRCPLALQEMQRHILELERRIQELEDKQKGENHDHQDFQSQ